MSKTFSLDDYIRQNPISDATMRAHLADNPCRGLIVGISSEGTPIQVSWIMGRSDNSKNRVYKIEHVTERPHGTIVKTDAFDDSLVEDPSLIIYTAMRSFDELHVVGNGSQVDSVIIQRYHSSYLNDYNGVLLRSYCEPDAPTFTPRITGVFDSFKPTVVQLFLNVANPVQKAYWNHVAQECGFIRSDFEAPNKPSLHVTRDYNRALSKASGIDYEAFPTDHKRFDLQVKPGIGYMITTYMPGHKTLDSFNVEPILVPLVGSVKDIADTCWSGLEPEWRVAVAARAVGPDGPEKPYIINRHNVV